MKQWLFCVCVIVLVWSPAREAQAADPLGIPPGVATNITLGAVVTLSAFNTTLGSADISYNNTDLATRGLWFGCQQGMIRITQPRSMDSSPTSMPQTSTRFRRAMQRCWMPMM